MHMVGHKRISKPSPFSVAIILKNSMDGETEMCELPTLQVNWVYVNHKRTKHDNIQGVTGGTDQTSGECSLDQTIPI